jgi:hypothetical protein
MMPLCSHQVILPRQQLTDDREILDFLLVHVGWFECMLRTITPRSCAIASKDPLFRAASSPKTWVIALVAALLSGNLYHDLRDGKMKPRLRVELQC